MANWRGIDVAGMHVMAALDFNKTISEQHFFLSIGDAVEYANEHHERGSVGDAGSFQQRQRAPSPAAAAAAAGATTANGHAAAAVTSATSATAAAADASESILVESVPPTAAGLHAVTDVTPTASESKLSSPGSNPSPSPTLQPTPADMLPPRMQGAPGKGPKLSKATWGY